MNITQNRVTFLAMVAQTKLRILVIKWELAADGGLAGKSSTSSTVRCTAISAPTRPMSSVRNSCFKNYTINNLIQFMLSRNGYSG